MTERRLSRSDVRSGVVTALRASVPGLVEIDIDPDLPFTAMGMDSIMAMEFSLRLSDEFDVTLPATVAFDYPTPQRLEYRIRELTGAGSRGSTIDGRPYQVERTSPAA